MAYRSPVSQTELREVVRNGESVYLDVVTGETYLPDQVEGVFAEIEVVKKKATKKSPAKNDKKTDSKASKENTKEVKSKASEK